MKNGRKICLWLLLLGLLGGGVVFMRMTAPKQTFLSPIPARRFLPKDFTITAATTWEDIQPFYAKLSNKEITSVVDLQRWLEDRDELEKAINYYYTWCLINKDRDTASQVHKKNYQDFFSNIRAQVVVYNNALDKKILANPHSQALRQMPGFDRLMHYLDNDVALYCADNIPIEQDIVVQKSAYDACVAAMTIIKDGKELTLQKAQTYLEGNDREVRQQVYQQVAERRLQDKDYLDTLFTTLVTQRHQIALNAGFKDYTGYKFASFYKSAYSIKDCLTLHRAIEKTVIPLRNACIAQHKERLGVAKLKLWDHSVDSRAIDKPLVRPFKHVGELLEQGILIFEKIHPAFGNCLRMMQAKGHLDLGARKGKAPGGYTCSLAEIGVPFIFMNATHTSKNIITLIHEGGHAMHAFAQRGLLFRNPPYEVCELASMAMELFTMDHWDIFFKDEAALKREKKRHLEDIMRLLRRVAMLDAFQHWVYANPGHTLEERKEAWRTSYYRFSDQVTDYAGQEQYIDYDWQTVLHLFKCPFYCIEYAIAQLGAIALWRNYKKNPQKTLKSYIAALQLGDTKDVATVYKTAGIAFDFRESYIQELMEFVRENLDAL